MNVTRKLKGVELELFLKISLFIWFDPNIFFFLLVSERGDIKGNFYVHFPFLLGVMKMVKMTTRMVPLRMC